MKYQIQVLSRKEFEKVARSDPRYQGVLDEKDPSAAFTDPKKGVVYVQKTFYPKVNQALIRHELEHLIEEHGTHEDEFGIRHKKWGKVLIPAALGILGGFAGAPFIGGLLGGGALGSAAGAGIGAAGGTTIGNVLTGQTRGLGRSALISGGLGAATAGVGSILGGGAKTAGGALAGTTAKATAGGVAGGLSTTVPGAAGNVAGKIGGGLSAFNILKPLQGGASAASPALQALGQGGAAAARGLGAGSFGGGQFGAGSQVGGQFGGIGVQAPGGGQPPIPPPQGGLNAFQSEQVAPRPVTPSAAEQAVQGGAQQGAATGATQAAEPNKLLGIFSPDELKRVGLGSAISMAPGLLGFGAPPEVPELGGLESIQALKAQTGRPITELSALAQSRLKERLGGQYSGLPGDVQSSIKRTFDRRRQEIASQFKLYRPNADLATDSQFRQVMEDLDRQEAEVTAQQQLQDRERFNTQQSQDIATALGIDVQTLNQMTQLANLDVQTIMLRLGLNAQQAQDFRNTFGQIGQIIASGGLLGGQGGLSINIGAGGAK